eukprot:14820906-Alexandrium_andersonii.AAC.1
MSASLVGSEMCIRDRRSVAAQIKRRVGERPTPMGGQSPRARPDVNAVSYTHLTLPTICSV